jgi:hypothetical protein
MPLSILSLPEPLQERALGARRRAYLAFHNERYPPFSSVFRGMLASARAARMRLAPVFSMLL